MSNVQRSTTAIRDLDAIWDFIAMSNQNPAAADKLLDEIEEVFNLVCSQPFMGTPVPHLRKNTRRVAHKSYLLFYEVIDHTPHVIRVLHQAQLVKKDTFRNH